MRRYPPFYLAPPSRKEVREVQWRGKTALADYLVEPDERHPANVWLYICTDQEYALEKLNHTMRKNVRRGLNALTIAPLTFAQVIACGAEAFCDTRRRLGRNDRTPETFHRHFSRQANWPELVFLGAWKDNQLAAFLSIIEVEDWAELHEIFSLNALLQYRPNDVLYYRALSHYLTERKCRLVYSGISSLESQFASKAGGVHRFKTKVGLEAQPVHRAFAPHALLHPFVNRLMLWGVNTALRFRPDDDRLNRAGAVLASMLGDTSMLEAASHFGSEE